MKKTNKQKCTSIGGQAVLEGVMMRGPKVTAMAVRNPEGELVIEKFPTEGTNKPKILKLPFVRGIFNMIDSLRFGYKCLMRSAEIAGFEEEEDEKKQGFIMGILSVVSVVLAVILSIGLFIYLPSLLFDLLKGVFPAINNNVWRSVFEGVLRIIVFICYLLINED